MSKLKLATLTTMILWSGFELSQMATAAQISVSKITTVVQPGTVSTGQYLALAKQCTIKRYRRPR